MAPGPSLSDDGVGGSELRLISVTVWTVREREDSFVVVIIRPAATHSSG